MKYNQLLRLGFAAATIGETTQLIIQNARQQFMIFKLANKHGVYLDSKEISQHKRRLIDYLKPHIKELNDTIKIYNSTISKLNINLKLKPIKISSIEREIPRFFKINKKYSSETHEALLSHVTNEFTLYLSYKFKDILEVLSQTKDYIDLRIDSFNIGGVSKKYQDNLREVVDLFFMGYKDTALLVLGRIFEEIITRYMIKLNKNKKINKNSKEILSMRFEDKLGLLKSKKMIGEKDWLIISKLKFDRNIGGHFVTSDSIKKSKIARTEAIEESEETIKLAFRLVNRFEKRIYFVPKLN